MCCQLQADQKMWRKGSVNQKKTVKYKQKYQSLKIVMIVSNQSWFEEPTQLFVSINYKMIMMNSLCPLHKERYTYKRSVAEIRNRLQCSKLIYVQADTKQIKQCCLLHFSCWIKWMSILKKRNQSQANHVSESERQKTTRIKHMKEAPMLWGRERCRKPWMRK